MTQATLLTYTEIRKREHALALHTTEIPVEHEKSLPIPTRRWRQLVYACFASPALRRPGQPREQGAPDRWWLVDAGHGRLVLYTLCKVMPYAQGVHWESTTLPPETRTIGELKELVLKVERLMNTLAPAFFAGEPGDPQARAALSEVLQAHVPAPLFPQYQALAPDFFAWLVA